MGFLRRDNRSKCREREMNTRETAPAFSQVVEHKEYYTTHGTRLVWNSFKSTFKEPSKRRDAVIDETTCAMRRFKFVKLGDEMPRLFLQIS
jgi:hypothetical protein